MQSLNTFVGLDMTLARRLGRAGEAAVGIVGPKIRIPIPGTSRTRVPDQLTATSLVEVKNVQALTFTQQLRDFSSYARVTGRTFELYVRANTRLSGPLQEAVARGDIILREIPDT